MLINVLKIKEVRDSSDSFSFKLVAIEDIFHELRALDISKATQRDDRHCYLNINMVFGKVML